MKSKEAIKIIFDLKQGSSTELKELIGEERFEGYCLMGVINDNFNHWEVTELGLKQWDFYRDPTFIEKIKGYYCHYILNF